MLSYPYYKNSIVVCLFVCPELLEEHGESKNMFQYLSETVRL